MTPANGTGGSIAVLGAGSWGTALAIQLARSGRRVLLWGRDRDAQAAMQDAEAVPGGASTEIAPLHKQGAPPHPGGFEGN